MRVFGESDQIHAIEPRLVQVTNLFRSPKSDRV